MLGLVKTYAKRTLFFNPKNLKPSVASALILDKHVDIAMLHVISLEFTRNPCKISPKISLLHGFPTFNAGNPHSIPVQQIPCKYYNGNQSVDISKLQGMQVYMQSP